MTELGRELRIARLNCGLSQATVARAARTCRSQVSRLELGQAPRATVLELARAMAVVGLEFTARAYPAGRPIRDKGHLALMTRLRQRVASTIVWRYEVPIGHSDDDRAWDAVLVIGRTRVALEAETRPHDVQALLRRIGLKLRDDPNAASVVLLLSDTRHNRALVRDFCDVLRADFPASTSEVLGSLRKGRAPERSGIVVL